MGSDQKVHSRPFVVLKSRQPIAFLKREVTPQAKIVYNGCGQSNPKRLFCPTSLVPMSCLPDKHPIFNTKKREKGCPFASLFLSISWVLSFYKVWQGFIEKKGTLGGCFVMLVEFRLELSWRSWRH
jgi:hypothetical protein